MIKEFKILIIFTTLLGAGLIFAQLVLAEDVASIGTKPTIEHVVSRPGKYDGANITLEGNVSKIKFTTSLSGKAYTGFKIVDSEKNTINVYAREHLDIKKGDKLRIFGKFKKEKTYLMIKFKNVVKAKTVEVVG